MDYVTRNLENKYSMCVSFILLITTGLCMSSMIGFIFWIIALINGKNQDIQETCKDSMLWEWLLVYGLFIVIVTGLYLKKCDEVNYTIAICKLFLNFTSMAGVCMLYWWGDYELQRNHKCVEKYYDNTIFYKTCIAFWWFILVAIYLMASIIGLVFIGIIGYNILLSCSFGRYILYKFSLSNNRDNSSLIDDLCIIEEQPRTYSSDSSKSTNIVSV